MTGKELGRMPAQPVEKPGVGGGTEYYCGLTIRQELAARFMAALIANGQPPAVDGKPMTHANAACFVADALLDELAKEDK